LFLNSVTAKEARPQTGAIAHFGAGAVTATPARNNKHGEMSPQLNRVFPQSSALVESRTKEQIELLRRATASL
jgi:hypothetical protein